LLRCVKSANTVAEELEDDERNGALIVMKALTSPLRQLASNAGASADLVVEKVMDCEGSVGWNAATGEYEDLLKTGVIDPKKVVRCALQNAASVAGLLLTTEAIVSDDPDEKKNPTT
jgi:chaperonin GroEL